MNTCALTRILWPSFLVGLVVGSIGGNDSWGWLAAAVTAAAIYGGQRVRGTSGSCPLPAPSAPAEGRAEQDV